MKDNLVFFNKNVYGKLEKEKIIKYDDNTLNTILEKKQNEIIKKDYNRKMISKTIFIFILLSLIVIAILSLMKILKISLITYTFIIALGTLIWVLLYYILGVIFYGKINLDFYFKNLKSQNPLTCSHYKSTNYAKYIEKMQKSLGKFTLYSDDKEKKLIVCALHLKNKINNKFIFNGLINSNIPYFYLSAQNIRIIFFPGIVVYINKKNSKVVKENRFKYDYNNEKCTLYIDNKVILSFYINGAFDINMLNFNY